MGLTERHWFEDEESELTENQLEDILWENNKIFERGYQKGFSDGKSAILQEQEPVEPKWIDFEDTFTGDKFKVPICGICELLIGDAFYCPHCGRKAKWDATT